MGLRGLAILKGVRGVVMGLRGLSILQVVRGIVMGLRGSTMVKRKRRGLAMGAQCSTGLGKQSQLC
jgi:hypothetical protein